MAGLFLAFGNEPGWAEQQRDSAVRRMLHYPWLRALRFQTGEFAAALVLPDDVPPSVWGQSRNGEFVAVFGEYYPDDTCISDTSKETERIAQLARDGHGAALRNQNGLYNLVVWEGARRRLTIANDATGSLLLFHWRCKAGAVWTSEPGLIDPGEGVDKRAIGSLLFRGYSPGDTTPHPDVSVFPPSCTELCVSDKDGLQFSRQQGIAEDDAALCFSDYGEALREAVTLRVSEERTIALPLTAGLDSRILLAELFAVLPSSVARERIRCLTLQAGQQRDPQVASSVAKATGVPHRVLSVPDGAIAGNLPLLRNALGTTADWHPAAHLAFCGAEQRGNALWLGFLGGTLAGARVHQRDALAGLLAMRSADRTAFGWPPAAPDSEDGDSENAPSVPPLGGYSPLAELAANLWERQRRYTSYLVRLAWNFTRPVCPYADRRLLHLALRASRAELADQSERRAWLCRAHPRLAAIPGNDGHPYSGSAGSTLRFLLRRAGIGRILGRGRRRLTRGYDARFLAGSAAELWEMLDGEVEFADLHPAARLALGPMLLLGTEDMAACAREAIRNERRRHAGLPG